MLKSWAIINKPSYRNRYIKNVTLTCGMEKIKIKQPESLLNLLMAKQHFPKHRMHSLYNHLTKATLGRHAAIAKFYTEEYHKNGKVLYKSKTLQIKKNLRKCLDPTRAELRAVSILEQRNATTVSSCTIGTLSQDSRLEPLTCFLLRKPCSPMQL